MKCLARLMAVSSRVVLALGVALSAAAAPARAQSGYPSRVITLVTQSSPGTALDVVGRLYADRIAKLLNAQTVVLNRPGAGGLIAARAVATAPADGYTLLVTNSGHAILGTLNKNLPFDPMGDFAGIAMIAEAPAVVTVPPALGVTTLKDFVELAKGRPDSIRYGSAGIGTSTHLAGAYFEKQAGVRMTHVPYRNTSETLSDLLTNRVQAVFSPVTPNAQQIKEGGLLGLAVSAREPMVSPVAVPTAISQGIDYEYSTWYGFLAPKETPPAVLAILAQAIDQASKEPDLKAQVEAQGLAQRIILLQQFDRYIRSDMARLDPILREIAAKAQ
jgi:tripartite-type tricarboxylate transporter receptor subunit TctC